MPRTILEDIVIQNFTEVDNIAFCQYTPIRFFEILHIEKGAGIITINSHKIKYAKNQIYILIPSDQYSLDIETSTTLSAVKFLYSFFNNRSEEEYSSQRKVWFKRIETILHTADRTSYLQLHSQTDESSLYALFKVLCNEYNDGKLRDEIVLQNTLHTILHIVSRNVNYISSEIASSKIQDIINYIHRYIHDSQKLSKRSIAKQFHLSENYISQYFKDKMSLSLKKYIINYKLKLAETRLRHTDLTTTEIAHDLGFTDSSHLDKTFLSHKGITVKAYKASIKTID